MLSKTSSPVILAIDSATTGCSVCVVRGADVLARAAQEMARGQAEVLIPMVQEVLAQADLCAQDLNAIAVTNGPGAFTGLRIGLAAARGLALALNLPCVGVTTLEVLAWATPPNERAGRLILACVESKRADIYVQIFSSELTPLSNALAADGPAVQGLFAGDEKVLLVGDAAGRAQEMLASCGVDVVMSQAAGLPDAALIAHLAEPRIDGAVTPQPLYLRPPDAKLPKAQGRGRP